MDLDIAPWFPPKLLGSALSKVWTLDGQQLVPVMDESGVEVCCPITLQTMHDPALLADGSVYDHDAIARWLRDHSRAPCTNVPLPHKHLLRLGPVAEAVQLFLALRGGSAERDDASLSARLLRASTAAEAALAREKTPAEVTDDEAEEKSELAGSGPSTQRALLEALEMCIAEGDTEVLQYQASLSRARRVAKEIHHELAATRFEANVRDLLGSSRWSERKASKAADKAERATREAAEKEARAAAAKHEAAAHIQHAWLLARRWRARRAMRQRLRQSRLHLKTPLHNKLFSVANRCSLQSAASSPTANVPAVAAPPSNAFSAIRQGPASAPVPAAVAHFDLRYPHHHTHEPVQHVQEHLRRAGADNASRGLRVNYRSP